MVGFFGIYILLIINELLYLVSVVQIQQEYKVLKEVAFKNTPGSRWRY